jgi:ATP-dependent Clp protease ATP-binding subunit ClpA
MVRLNVLLDPKKTGASSQFLETGLRRLVIGQDEAVNKIVNIYQMFESGMCAPGRPVGSLLFLGPTGTGKTRIVEATAETLVGNPRAVIKVDCAEFQHSHEIAKLVGSPPGYLGHRETHPMLSQEVLNQHHTDKMKLSFVLFDEIEKASDSLWNLLLGILDKATLTLGDNRKVDFSRALIFMTSNLGAERMVGGKEFGFAHFANALIDLKAQQLLADNRAKQLTDIGLDAARRKFKPEFLNRLDVITSFRPLDEPAIRRILDVELNLVQQRIYMASTGRAFVFTVSDAAKNFLIARGTDTNYGARYLKRTIERLVVQPLSNLISTAQVRGGDWVRIEYADGNETLDFFKEAEDLSVNQMQMLSGPDIATLPVSTGLSTPAKK